MRTMQDEQKKPDDSGKQDRKETQDRKASFPMVLSPSEKWMRLRFLQKANASFPIFSTDDGSVSSSSSSNPLKFSLPIAWTPSSITIWRNGAFDLTGTSQPSIRLPETVNTPSSVILYVITVPSFHVLRPLLTILDIIYFFL